MKQIGLLFLIILLVGTSCGSGADKKNNNKNPYTLQYSEPKEDIIHDWNHFYPAYYLYISMIMTLELDRFISEDNMGPLVKTAIKLLSHNRQVQIKVPGYHKRKDLIITITPVRPPENPDNLLILFLTNYSFKENRIVSGDDLKYAYAFFVKPTGNKWVKLDKVYSEEKEAELQDEGSLNNLADYYLLDDNTENDSEIEGLLKKEIAENENAATRCFATFTLGEYYVMSGDYDKAAWQIEEGSVLLTKLSDKDQKNMGILVQFTKGLLDLTRFVAKDEEFWQAEIEELF